MSASKLVQRDVIDVRQLELRCGKTVAYGFTRKSRPMFDTTEALFLRRSDQLAINDERR